MTVERDKLERAVTGWWSAETIMGLADAYAAAERLAGHVDACILRDWSALPQGKRELTQSEVEDLLPKCGQGGWYCERAPKEGR